MKTKDDPVARKRPVSYEAVAPDAQADKSIDTVALICIAVVSKAEYDAMAVKGIDPIVVRGGTGNVTIPPFLLVGGVENTRDEAISRINKVWEAFIKRKEEVA